MIFRSTRLSLQLFLFMWKDILFMWIGILFIWYGWKWWIYNVLKVLFEKLCLHEQCENKKLPKTLNKQQQSTSEAAVRRSQMHTFDNESKCCCRMVLDVLSNLPLWSSHPFPCSCCSCKIYTPCQRSFWSTDRSASNLEGIILNFVFCITPGLPKTMICIVTFRFTRSSRRLLMGFSHAWWTRWAHISALRRRNAK